MLMETIKYRGEEKKNLELELQQQRGMKSY